MALKNLFLIGCLLIFSWGSECPDGFIKIKDICYYKKHLDVLQDFVDNNQSLNGLEPNEIGYQEWTNNRLTYLYLGDNNIIYLPDSIGLLKDLNNIDVRENKITSLPDGICNIYPYYTNINLSGNQICPPYPYCFDYISSQNIEACDIVNCPSGYLKIDQECYNKEHIQILQSLISSNPILEGLTPLDLGKEIGHQRWKNGKLTHLDLVSNQLSTLPESLCSIYKSLEYFDVSNNIICPPYPTCFEYIGYQNTENCNFSNYNTEADLVNNLIDNREILPISDIASINSNYFQSDLEILHNFIENNKSLEGMEPLEIGIQIWSNMRLHSLDLSSIGLTYIPEELCNIYSNLTIFDVSNNAICPPYPKCIEYIEKQDKELCGDFFCPSNYIEINEECYYNPHLDLLKNFISDNLSLIGIEPLDITKKSGFQKWRNGKIEELVLSGNSLIKIPENLCSIYGDISVFDISNNSICPPYPSCVENIGYQNTEDCSHSLSCPDGHVVFDEKCYYYDDLQVLVDFTKLNSAIEAYHPLLLGYQLWKNNRLNKLSLDGWNITEIPQSIYKLEHLEFLNLKNNKLAALPESFCDIYSNLQSLQIANNLLCPPYLYCFDFIGEQNTNNCEPDFCPYGYIEIDKKCYYEKDVSILNDFINLNESLSEKNPLEIGVQKWKNMRLNFLYLGVNELTAIPESICEISSNLSTLNISQNNVCPPYPICVEEYIGEQNTSACP